MALFNRTREKTQEPAKPLLKPAPAPVAETPAPRPTGVPQLATPAKNGRFEIQSMPPKFRAVKDRVQQKLLEGGAHPTSLGPGPEARIILEPIFNETLAEEDLVLNRTERQRFFDMIMAEILGYGPIQALLDDDSVSEVMVNGPKFIYAERKGKLTRMPVAFDDNDHVLRIIERIVAPLGRRIDESSPMVDARLPDGSRVNAIVPPLALDGPSITIRKFSKVPLTVQDLIRFGSFTEEFAIFTEACVRAHLNIIVSGGTGSGKTTLLNVLSSFIPEGDRIVTIEDAAELQLRQEHVVRLETRPANVEGKGRIGIRELVINSLRMRPDRIVVGEVRGGEALDMLQAMNTGHDGSLTTAHSNGPRDTLARIETMVLMAGMDLPLRAIRQQIASAVDLIIHTERLRDGSRRVVKCTEVIGMEGEMILLQDVFEFVQEGMDGDKIIGSLQPTGIRPKLTGRLEAYDIHLPPQIFGLPDYTR